jgi:membrane-bound serine protease (ClpP class)
MMAVMVASIRGRLLALLALGSALGLAGGTIPAAPSPSGGTGVLIPVAGPIGPATSDFFVRQLHAAQDDGAVLVVMTLDTPGGLETSMRDMVQAILASNVPVVTFVAPSGARAASAGTYLLYASHVAAMAPATNLGAATPVQIGGPSTPAKEPETALERKSVYDATAYIVGLAHLRGRNAEWAAKAVREGASLPSDEALAAGVIDVVATDLPQLLKAIDGRVVKLQTREATLATGGLVLRDVQPDWRTDLLSLITNPNVAYLLMLIGIYGLLLEGYHPGTVLPGVVGAISLLLALFAFQVLSVNFAGLALIALGVLLIVAESFVPSFGALGLGGIVAFVIGSIMLLDSGVPGYSIAWQLIGAMGLAGALLLLAIVSFAVRARRRPVVSGVEGLLREQAQAVESFESEGRVRAHGEIWAAVSREPIREGQRLRILAVKGLRLEVEPVKD